MDRRPCQAVRIAAIKDVDRFWPVAEALVAELWPKNGKMALELLARGALNAEEARRLGARAEWCRKRSFCDRRRPSTSCRRKVR
jgi:hypothetical protein